MRTIETTLTVAADGSATLDKPVRLPAGRHRVVVLVEELVTEARDDPGRPPGFFEETYDALADDPLTRPEQGAAQGREAADS